jgi:hypothetical protein
LKIWERGEITNKIIKPLNEIMSENPNAIYTSLGGAFMC